MVIPFCHLVWFFLPSWWYFFFQLILQQVASACFLMPFYRIPAVASIIRERGKKSTVCSSLLFRSLVYTVWRISHEDNLFPTIHDKTILSLSPDFFTPWISQSLEAIQDLDKAINWTSEG